MVDPAILRAGGTGTEWAEEPDAVVIFENVRKRYGSVHALVDLTLCVRQGDVTALLGPNGAGKTTLMEILTGIRVADAGNVRVLGLDPRAERFRLAQRLGVQVQEFKLQSTVRVREALAFFASLHADPEDIDLLLDRFGLMDKARARFPALSGGQKRRLAIAKALVGRPELVVLDEPTSGLDPQGQQFLRQETQRLRAEGRSVLLSTHDVEDAARLADNVVIVDHGRVVATGKPADIVQENCFGWRVIVDRAADPSWSRHPEIRVVDDAGRAVVYGRDSGTIRAVTGEIEILEERRPNLHDAYFVLTGSALRS